MEVGGSQLTGSDWNERSLVTGYIAFGKLLHETGFWK